MTANTRQAVIIGGGVAGLASALSLSRVGFACTILERDREVPPSEPDLSSEEWARKSVPQFRHSHIFLARLRNILVNHFPDLLENLLASGVQEVDPLRFASPTVRRKGSMEGDASLISLASRRSLFEWVLLHTALAEPSISLQRSVRVGGIRVEGETGSRIVRSVITNSGDLETPDLVLDASGRTSRLWQDATTDDGGRDTTSGAISVPSRICYLTRFYRTTDELELSPGWEELGWARCSIFPADHEMFSVTLILDEGSERISSLRDAEEFDRTVERIPMVSMRLAGANVIPVDMNRVQFMGGLRTMAGPGRTESSPANLLRVGDAGYTTNPTLGQGVTLAFIQAQLLHTLDGELETASRMYDQEVARVVAPYFRRSLKTDRLRGSESANNWTSALRGLVADSVRDVTRRDPVVFRAYMRGVHMLEPPVAALLKPGVLARLPIGALISRLSRDQNETRRLTSSARPYRESRES